MAKKRNIDFGNSGNGRTQGLTIHGRLFGGMIPVPFIIEARAYDPNLLYEGLHTMTRDEEPEPEEEIDLRMVEELFQCSPETVT